MQDDSSQSATTRPAPAASWSTFALCVATLLVFLLGFRFSGGPAGYDIDPSWAAVVTWGVSHGAQWGRDLVFTYGPLGLLSPQFSHSPTMLPLAACGQIILSALYSILFGVACSSLNLKSRLALLLIVIWFGTAWAGDVLWLTLHPIALLALWRVRESSPRVGIPLALMAGTACAIPWLIKFSLFPLWLLWLLCTPLAMGRRGRFGYLAAGASMIASLALWRLLGQEFSMLPEHLRTALEVAIGYADAMQRPGAAGTDAVGYLALALSVCALAIAFACARRPMLERCSIFALATATVALAFKSGFTRVDLTHLLVFFPTAAAVAVLASSVVERDGVRNAATAAALACAACAFALPALRPDQRIFLAIGAPTVDASIQRAKDVIAYEVRAAELGRLRARMQADTEMPLTKAAVAGESIDILSVGQGLLLLHGFDYRPRPIFQGYSAYTPRLAAMNRASLASANGPRWVLLDLRAIDGRLPTSEDPLALLEVIQTYTPRLSERGLLLMRRDSRSRAAARAVAQAQARLGEWIVVPSRPGRPLALDIELDASAWGRAASLLQRAPRLYIDLELDDGAHPTYRLAPGAARSGFLLSPHIDSPQGLWRWLVEDDSRRVRRIRLRGETWLGHAGFEPTLRLRYNEPALSASPEPD